MGIISIALIPQVNLPGIAVYDIPTEEINNFESLLPHGSQEIGYGVFTVPNLLSAEKSCDSLYASRKMQNVEF